MLLLAMGNELTHPSVSKIRFNERSLKIYHFNKISKHSLDDKKLMFLKQNKYVNLGDLDRSFFCKENERYQDIGFF